MTLAGDTIAAIATAPGKSGVAVVRVSGPDAFAVAGKVARRRPEPGRIVFADFSGLDKGILLAFKSPRSYTGEDTVEFQCHGGAVTPRRILAAAIAAGARLAGRGEFTFRAFMNGKLSLEGAEGVLSLIEARTDRAADDALAALSGESTRRAKVLYSCIVELSATLEHALDVDEGELPGDFLPGVERRIAALRADLESEESRARACAMRREGALVVLAGAPNAGKSSLLNALLSEDRAIVSPVPGTTRDAIEAWTDLRGWPVRLVDTAGLRESGDAIESEGVRRAKGLISKADLTVVLFPADAPLPAAPETPAGNSIAVLSKADLAEGPADGLLRVSAKTGEGVEALKDAMAERLESVSRTGSGGDDRLAGALALARASLPVSAADPVLAANALRRSAEALGGFLGADWSADLLDNLFSRFCVGK
ncbi:MAG: tRNA modification GTPase [Kiritimatiellae bacterium]|nr:tRNA modification GTPase [Kiritimatiellia bacterium]